MNEKIWFIFHWPLFLHSFWIELWCNGSTTDFGSVCLGSNPSSSTKKPVISTGFLFLYLFINVLTLAFLQFPPISGTVPVF